MRYLCLFVLSGCLLFIHISSRGQSNFQHLTTSDGLSHNTVQDLLQDRKGFLWFATTDGLNRYDGRNFQIYRRSLSDKRSLSSNEVTCLLEDKKGRIWLGTRSGGISQFDSSGTHFNHLLKTTKGADISTAVVNSLAQDENGNLWAATHGLGLLLIDPDTKKVQQFNTIKGNLPGDHILRVYPDKKGNLWIGFTNAVLVKMNLKNYHVQRYVMPDHSRPVKTNFSSIFCDSHGNVWAGTEGGGLFRYEEKEDSFTSVFYKEGVVDGVNIARSLYEDKSGNYWLGTDDGLIFSYDIDFKQIRHYRAEASVPGSLSTHAANCVKADRQGNIWVGMWDGGLNVLFARPGLFDQYQYQPGQPNSLLAPQVSAISADQDGNVWLGSRRGLTYLNRKTNTYSHFTHRESDANSLAGNDITSVRQITAKSMMVSMWNNGTDIVDSQTGRVLKHYTQFKTERLLSIMAVDADRAYVASNKSALWEMNLHTWEIRPVETFPQTKLSFTTMTAGPDSTIWLGTFDEGLLEWQPKTGKYKFHHTTLRAGGLYDGHIICMFKDRKQVLWIGTLGGLHRYNASSKRFEIISIDNGLPNDAIMSIQQDRTGLLWIATNNGLSQMSEDGKILRTYRKEDGLAGNDFTERAVSQSPDGTLFWGGKHGLTVFNPARANFVSPSFPVYLTGMKLFNQPVVPGEGDSPLIRDLPETESVTLRHNQSVVTFDFSAVLFQMHRNVHYAYRLEGFEEAWNYVGTKNSATYTNLDPGTYELLVKASTSDDFKNASETKLQIVVLPPWYRTYWAYLLYAALVAGLLMLIRWMIQVREGYKTELRIEHIETEKARELDRLRSGFFTNISHEFRTPLTLILTPLEELLSDNNAPDSRRPWFQTMHQNANRLLRLINQLLDLSKLESGLLRPEISRQDILEFVRRIVGSFEQIAIRQRIKLEINADTDHFPAFFDPDILEKVLYNLIANSLKYTAEGGTITIFCHLINQNESPELLLEVKDSGIGIANEHLSHIFDRFYQVNGQHQVKKAGTGIGLALTRELIEVHRGSIAVESQHGAGATFTVRLPVYEKAFPTEWLSNRPEDLKNTAERAEVWLETANESQVNDADRARPLILVVEDNDDLRRYVSECFNHNYRVLQASNGKEALEQAEKEVPDLIVSDWLMPDMDGVQLCEAIKSNEKTSHVPLILLTSKSSTESKIQGLGVGADDYVTKPFNVDVLRTRAKNLIQGRVQLRTKYSRMLYLKPSDIEIDSAEEQFLKKVLSLIETHMSDPDFDIQRLENELGMSNTQFYRKLKALTGKGGNELIRSIRLERARQYLGKGGMQIAEVAYQVGFNDANYFVRAFKKEFGVSPGSFVKANLQVDVTGKV
jgi:signal transduction histidine kinase/ligand-binding sensor domain-containing protein/DNA-binding response OmpR family regulator